MTIYSIFKECQRVWSVWNIRILVVSSLWLQILLIILSPFRRRRRSVWLSAVIWLCYLMADYIAIYSIGVIANNSRYSCDAGNCVDPDLAAFWAPFLLLHLGGPDTITAFSVEDNTLWMRHFLNMIVEVAVVLYVLFLAVPSNALWLPFLLVFVAGTIKYAERTRSLYLACYGNIKELWSQADKMENFGTEVKDDMDVLLQAAYRLYKISRKTIYRQRFTKEEYEEGRRIMDGLEPEKAFSVVAEELSFIYDELFTKMGAVHRGRWFSYFLRLICSALIVSAFVIFSATKKLKVLHNVDIAVTYALLIGAMFLDFIAIIMLVFSERTVAFLKDHSNTSKVLHSIYRKINIYNSGWCESISQHNLISYWMNAKHRQQTRFEKWLEAIIEYFGLTTTFEELRYKYDGNMSQGLKEFIYNYLKELDLEEREEIISSKGRMASSRLPEDWKDNMRDGNYESWLLVLHIMTDIGYFKQKCDEGNNCDSREICKVLSDYMFYLYIMRPSLISVRQGAFFQSRIDNVCEEIRSALSSDELPGQRDVCMKFAVAKGVLDADDDITIEDEEWEGISKEWMKMLIYGAYHSEGKAHAQQLAKGREFITHVWLLMAHFGLNDCSSPKVIMKSRSQTILFSSI